MAELDTLPKLLKANYEKYGDRKLGMSVKDLGIWQPYTWKDYYENVKYFSLGLISLGLEPGDNVAILGETKPESYWAELAAQACQGAAVGIFTDCMPEEVKYFVSHSDSKFVVVHDQEQTDKLLKIKDDLPLLKKVIYWDPKGLWNYNDPILMSFEEVVEIGKKYDKLHPGLFEANVERGSGDYIAVLCYTSGTTGLPKGAMISHNALIGCYRAWSTEDPWEDCEYLSFLPLAWVTEQSMVTSTLCAGIIVNFTEDPETVQADIRESGPGLMFWGSRNWESVNRLIQAKMIDTTPFNRFLYHLCLPIGYKIANLEAANQKVGLFWRILNFLAYWAVFRDLRDKVGLLKTKYAYTGGAQISPDVVQYFKAIGVGIKVCYGSSEYPLVSVHRSDDVIPETSGRPLIGVEVRISEEGEVLVRGTSIFSGYYKNPEATEKKFRAGYYCSEDFGHITEDGHLVVMDRIGDLRMLRDGAKFSPQYLESRLRFSPYIKDVLVIGNENADFVAAVVNIDIDNVGRWAESKHIPYTTYTDLSQKPEVIELIKIEILKVNRLVPEKMRIKKFANLHKEFDPDEAELTRTRKLKREFMENRYADIISSIYGDKKEVPIEAAVTYRDGRKGVIKTSITANTVE